MVVGGRVVCVGVEIVFGEEHVDFVGIVLCVYDPRGFAFARVIIAFSLVIFWFICFSTHNCLLCVVLYICVRFLPAKMWKQFWILLSSNFIACSVSSSRFVQVVADGFCRLYCTPRSSSAGSLLVNCMLVRLMVCG